MASLFGEDTQETTEPTQETTTETTQTTEVQPQVTTPQSTSEEDWKAMLPEEFREAGWVNRHESLDGFMQSMSNAQSILGRKNGIPDFENDKPEVIAEFRKKLGVPVDAKDYKIDTPEGFTPDEGYEQFLALAHKGNVPNDVANELFQMGQAQIGQALSMIQTGSEDAIAQAYKEFADNPRFEEISVNVKGILNKVDPSGEVLSVDDLEALGVHAPKVAMFLDKIATSVAGDSKVIGADITNSGRGTRQDQIKQVYNDHRAGRISQESANQKINQINASYNIL